MRCSSSASPAWVSRLPTSRRIDLLSTIDGVEFEACYLRRMEVEVAGVRLPILGLEDFKTNKRSVGRAKDLADLESLEGPPEV